MSDETNGRLAISVGRKVVVNYQSYDAHISLSVDVSEDDNIKEVSKQLSIKVRRMLLKELTKLEIMFNN